jgi:hypothetical protein
MKRPFSYSEGYVSELKIPNDITSNLLSINTIDSSIQLEATVVNKNEYIELILNKLISFTFHLLLIAGFEIIFFNFFILNYENNSLISLGNQIVQPIINTCSNVSNNSKLIIDDFINLYINQTIVNNNAYNDYINRIYVNKLLLYKSVYYFVGILCFFIGLVITNFYYFNQKIKFAVIIIDNIIMISILGIYEYIFFKTIIFKYVMITSNELIKIILQNILFIC